MRLFFHIGMNKAGSTYLQNLFSHNHDRLLAGGLFYRSPKFSRGIGGAQGGNAVDFAFSLGRGDEESANSFLQETISEASKCNATSILLSTEFMFHFIVHDRINRVFKNVCFANGIREIQLLLVLRSPVSHALSAYAQSVGKHDISPFDKWLEKGFSYSAESYEKGVDRYVLWQELQLLCNLISDEDYAVQATSHERDLKAEAERFLGIDNLEKPANVVSNISVNCVEADLLRFARVKYPMLVKKLRHDLKELPRWKKAPDSYVRNLRERLVYTKALKFGRELSELGLLIREPDFFREPEEKEQSLFDVDGTPYFLLSKYQLEVLFESAVSVRTTDGSCMSKVIKKLRLLFLPFRRFLKGMAAAVSARVPGKSTWTGGSG